MTIENKDVDLNNDEDNLNNNNQGDQNDNQDDSNKDDSSNQDNSFKNIETPDAKRARLTRQLEQLDKKFPSAKAENKTTKSNDLGYGEKAFLVANGVKGENESKLVQSFMQETGKTLEQVLDSKYFQAELNEMRELSTTANAAISGKRSGNVATNTVEYWMGKDFKDVPADMKSKVVNARMKTETSKGQFYNS